MDDILEAIAEIVVTVLEGVFDNIKNPRKRKWVLTCFYSVLALVFDGFLLWPTISFLKDENHIGAAVLGGIMLLATVICAFIIIRGHRRNW